jgi:type IV pilus assembly protein PilM
VAKAVLLEKTAKGLAVVTYAESEVPGEPGAGEQAAAWLGSLLSKVGWRGEPVAVTVSARETLLRELTVPFTDAEQLDKVVSFEAENYLPFPLEEAVLDFLPIAREAASTRLLVFAVRKATLAALQNSLRRWGWTRT